MRQDKLYFGIAILTMLSALNAQQVDFPTWGLGRGTMSSAPEWVLPEYSGGRPDFARAFVSDNRRILMLRNCTIRYVATSGVMAVDDTRGALPGRYGVDTGLSRVMHVVPMATTSLNDPIVLVCGSNAEGRSRVKRVQLSANAPTVSDFSPLSAVSEIWCRCGYVNGFLYVFDLQAHVFKRFSDLDSDGVPDTLDSNFGLMVTPDSCRDVRDITPFDSFERSDVDTVLLRTAARETRRVIGIALSEAGGFALRSRRLDADVAAVPAIYGPLVVDQKRLHVAARHHDRVSIVRRIAGAPDTPLCDDVTMSSAGSMVVELHQPLECGWSVMAIDSTSQRESVALTVTSDLSAVLFGSDRWIVKDGDQVTLRGDLFRLDRSVVCLFNGQTLNVQSTMLSTGEISVVLPLIGSNDENHPLRMGSVHLALEDSSGVVASNAIRLSVWHRRP